MAFPIIPIAMGLASLASSFFGARSQKKANEANVDLAREQMQWNERMWNRQNVYNDPSQQMARLRDAGLNPRLIYGASSGQAAGNAGDVKGYDRADHKAQWNGTTAFNDFVHFAQMEAQTDNTRALTEVSKQEAANKAQDLLNKQLENEVKSFELGISKDLRETNINAARANADSAMFNALTNEANADVAINTKDARIKKADIEVEKAVKDLEGQALENRLKELSIELKEQGVEQSDHIIFRLLARHLDNVFDFMEDKKLPSKKGNNTTFPLGSFPNPNKF